MEWKGNNIDENLDEFVGGGYDDDEVEVVVIFEL